MTTSSLGRTRPSSPVLVTAALLGLPYVLGILLLTLSPRAIQNRMPQALDLVLEFAHDSLGWHWLGFTRLELIANVLVFVPIGVLAFMLLRARLLAVALLVGPLLSLSVELMQAMLLPHRIASFVDVAANSLGATAGVLAAWAVSSLIRALSEDQ